VIAPSALVFSPPDRTPDRLEGLRVLVFGLGGFGGGAGAARFLAERGAEVTVTDLRSAAELSAALSRLEGVTLAGSRLGGHDEEDFRRAEWVVVNPAVPPGAPLLSVAARAGARLVTEIGLFLSWCPTPYVAGITGSNGKSTTCRLLADILAASGLPARLGGNFGGSLLGELGAIGPEERVVLELSSFQLARLGDGTPRPAAVAITQIAANHLDWHGSFAAYRAAKEEILAPAPSHAPAGIRVAALPRDALGEELGELAGLGGRRTVSFGADDPGGDGVGVRDGHLVAVRGGETQRLARLESFPRRGPHDLANAATACALALPLGARLEAIEPTIAAQRPLPHRQERVAEIAGVVFVDDSKATTPEAARAAIEAVAPRALLLAGGRHKGGDLAPLAEAVRRGARAAICFGECRDLLADALRRGGVAPERIDVRPDLASAFRRAAERALPGDVVLLSPACASYDEFRSYEERADRFRALVAEHARAASGAMNPSG